MNLELRPEAPPVYWSGMLEVALFMVVVTALLVVALWPRRTK